VARVFGNINVGIWLDQDFCNLSPGAQRTYFQLITQSDIAACGTLALTTRRWSMTVPERYRFEFPEWMEELARERFIIIDEDTEELLVRSFVKWDGGYKNGNRLMAIKGTAEAVRSPLLRSVLAFQLSKVGISEVPSNALPTDFERPSNAVETPKVVVTLGELEVEPETSTRNQEPGTVSIRTATAQTLVASWIDHCQARPPSAVIGKVAKHVGALLAEGIDPAHVERGLAAWKTKGLDASLLPSVVNEVMNAQHRQSTGTQRATQGLQIAAQLRAEGL
jgi:hypothetical protein